MQDLKPCLSDFDVGALFYHIVLQLETLDFPWYGVEGPGEGATNIEGQGAQRPSPTQPSWPVPWARHLGFCDLRFLSANEFQFLDLRFLLAAFPWPAPQLWRHAKLCGFLEIRVVCCRGLFKLCEKEGGQTQLQTPRVLTPTSQSVRRVGYWHQTLQSHLLNKGYLWKGFFLKNWNTPSLDNTYNWITSLSVMFWEN